MPARWKLELDAHDLASPTLEKELSAQLAQELEHAPPDELGPEERDTMTALVTQAVAIATSHKLAGGGLVELVKTEAGGVMVSVHHGEAVVAQNLDPSAVANVAAARKLAARKVVVPAVVKGLAAPKSPPAPVKGAAPAPPKPAFAGAPSPTLRK